MNAKSSGQERRRFPREKLDVRAVIHLPRGTTEEPVPVVDISANGLAVSTGLPLAVGQDLSVHVDRIGPACGRVVRLRDNVACIALEDDAEQTEVRRRRIAWRSEGHADRRQHQRARPMPADETMVVTTIERADGNNHTLEVMDISAGGILVRGDVGLQPEEQVRVGGIASTVTRQTGEAVAITFDGERDTRRVAVSAVPRPPAT